MATGPERPAPADRASRICVSSGAGGAGCLLASATWHAVWDAAHNGPPEIRPVLLASVANSTTSCCSRSVSGILFPLLLFLGLCRRGPVTRGLSQADDDRRACDGAPCSLRPGSPGFRTHCRRTAVDRTLSSCWLCPCWHGISIVIGESIGPTGSFWRSTYPPRWRFISPGTSRGGTGRSTG